MKAKYLWQNRDLWREWLLRRTVCRVLGHKMNRLKMYGKCCSRCSIFRPYE